MTFAAPKLSAAILLATHNGARFLPAQLDSIARQTHPDWALWVSDDGSNDGTLGLLVKTRATWAEGKLNILKGPGLGSSANFLSLVCSPDIQADMYAYADQDDIWYPDKLARAAAWLATIPSQTPALYFSRSDLIDEDGRDLGVSRLYSKPPSFQNALVQNIGGGNTMVFNRAACELLRVAGPAVPVVVHDWWTYMTVAGCGGAIFSDPAPTLQYRQHGENQIGSNRGFFARAIRAMQLLEGRFKGWTDVNLRALERIDSQLTPHNRAVLRQFAQARGMPWASRLIGVVRSGIYRQTFLDNLGLYLAAALNRL